MNIFILNWRDIKHPLTGGAEISLFEHAKYWESKGANVIWVASSFEGALQQETIGGIKILRKGSQYTTHICVLFYFLQGLIKKTDIVIDCFHFIPYFTPLYIKKNKIIALINEPAKNAWFKNIFFPVSFIGYIMEPFFFRFYQNIPFITSARSIVTELLEYGIGKKDIFLIPHGIAMSKTDKKFIKDKNVIIYLGQLSEDKGIKDALYAFSIIKNTYKDAKLWVVGKAPDIHFEEEMKQFAHTLGIDTDVRFYGYVSEDKKLELLTKAAILIHTSIREGWGLTIIEANAVGTPAVGYNVTGLRDSIQDKKTGLLAQKNTPDDLACTVISLMKDERLYERLSKNAKVWSKTFNWESAGEKSWKLLKRVYKRQ